MANEREYEVGYGKPPTHTRWKQGQSGNPKGRPRRTNDFDALLDLELGQTLRITEGGQQRTLTKLELFLKKLVHDAIQGDRHARRLLMPYVSKRLAVEEFEPDAGDREAFQRLTRDIKADDESPRPKEDCDG